MQYLAMSAKRGLFKGNMLVLFFCNITTTVSFMWNTYTVEVQLSYIFNTILLVACVNIQNLLEGISPLLWGKSACVTPLVQESGLCHTVDTPQR